MVATFLIALLTGVSAGAFTLTVTGSDGAAVTQYRWVVEEDVTYHAVPGVSDPQTIAVRFHTSYMPVVAQGDESTPLPALDPGKHYFVSVLPKADYSNSGAPIAPGQQSVTVLVATQPVPTAQISVFVFQDDHAINNAPDLGEHGLAGFSVLIDDLGGNQSKDAFGNPLGTTYDANGDVVTLGSGVILTDADGKALVKYVHPGKYGVQVVPPTGSDWVQTSTIEGTKVVDAWVIANEAPFFAADPAIAATTHVFFGFVQPMVDTAVLNGSSTVTGNVRSIHVSRPPDFIPNPGAPFAETTPWIGLNDQALGGRGIYVQRANADGSFAIPNVPRGSYQLVVWDDHLDLIIGFQTVTVPDGGGIVDLGIVTAFDWFAKLHGYVFVDENENGFRDPGEEGIPDQAMNIRFRDGSIYQALTTDDDGWVHFDEVFPFFNWLVAEVDFAKFKATGVTSVVDDGGPIDLNDQTLATLGAPHSVGRLNPQPQPDNGGLPYRTDLSPPERPASVLLEGFQGILGQTNVLLWGKTAYPPGDVDNAPYGNFPGPEDDDDNGNGVFEPGNGGIAGIVHYSTTRAENDPRLGAAEDWEPGIPRVKLRLWNSDRTVFLSEVETDSWDDNLPTGCPTPPYVHQGYVTDCFDSLRNWTQVRPAVFDGGYAFDSRWLPSFDDPNAVEVLGLPPGEYIVEVIPPPGYEVVKEEDKNVDFGDAFVPALATVPILIPECVGEAHDVPPQLELFPGIDVSPLLQDIDPTTPGLQRPLCDRKRVNVRDGQNAAADFYLFTDVPVAAHIHGLVSDDLANETNPNSPWAGEKYGVPWISVSIRDWTGQEITRLYTDQWGVLNGLVPSTYTANVAAPSGVSPNMLNLCLNDPVLHNPDGTFTPDPNFNRQYGQFCYVLQFMPGTTTYIDTPMLAVSAFGGQNDFPLDCELPNGTPGIFSVSGLQFQGPYVVPVSGNSAAQLASRTLVIAGQGPVTVPNPAYDGFGGTQPKTIVRDYGFGAATGTVRLGTTTLQIVSWSPGTIVARVPVNTPTGELVVTRGDNQKASVVGVTVTVDKPGSRSPIVVAPNGTIQAAIDAAQPDDLILVPPGTHNEMVVMWKPVRLQGWGAGSTTISAIKFPTTRLLEWRDKVLGLIGGGVVSLLPPQSATFTGGPDSVLALFGGEAPAITVLSKNTTTALGGFGFLTTPKRPNSRIDGLTLTASDTAGGVLVNGYAHYLEISNNRITGNLAITAGGGIRIGHPNLPTLAGTDYQNAFNDHIVIRDNHILQNGTIGSVGGGGVALFTGSDSYQVIRNTVCGNFSEGLGAGITHMGLSPNALIANNAVLFNESFNQGLGAQGAGIYVGGAPPLNRLTPGSGTVTVNANLIQGNQAGSGDGGGIAIGFPNGLDVALNPTKPANWYGIDIFNNMIVDNVAGLAGGGISIQDAARIRIIHNTIADNDSTATAATAFTNGIHNPSTSQPAGIAARAHSLQLAAAFGPKVLQTFSNPTLSNNIIWHNRSFFFTSAGGGFNLRPLPSAPAYKDLGVLDTGVAADKLDPRNCILTSRTGYSSTNSTASPNLVAEYVNTDRASLGIQVNPLQAPAAFDEGGNFIRVRFGPLTTVNPTTSRLFADPHITAKRSGAKLPGGTPALEKDYDGQNRPTSSPAIGADQR